jgi:hypothetical protein
MVGHKLWRSELDHLVRHEGDSVASMVGDNVGHHDLWSKTHNPYLARQLSRYFMMVYFVWRVTLGDWNGNTLEKKIYTGSYPRRIMSGKNPTSSMCVCHLLIMCSMLRLSPMVDGGRWMCLSGCVLLALPIWHPMFSLIRTVGLGLQPRCQMVYKWRCITKLLLGNPDMIYIGLHENPAESAVGVPRLTCTPRCCV